VAALKAIGVFEVLLASVAAKLQLKLVYGGVNLGIDLLHRLRTAGFRSRNIKVK